MRAEGYYGVLARAGFNKKYNRDVSWQELKDTFTLYKRIPMIVAGGDHYGRIDPNTAVGFIDAKIDEETQTIRMDSPVFYDEKFEQIPAEIQADLLYKKFIPASLGYEQFGDLRKIDHILIGAKDPVFPDVGINAEDGFYYEETEGMSNREAKQEEEASEPAKSTPAPMVTFTPEQFQELLATLRPPEQPPQETVAEEATAEEPPVPEENEPVPEPQEPEAPPLIEGTRSIPRATTKATNDGYKVDEFGRRYISYTVAGKKEEKT